MAIVKSGLNHRFLVAGKISLCIDLNDRQGNPQTDLVIELYLDLVGSVFLKLHTAEKMDIRGMGIQISQTEGNLGLGDGLIFLRVVNEALLDEVSAAAAPAGPETEFEKTDRQGGSGNGSQDTDESLLPTKFSPHIFAENGRLKVGKNEIGAHGVSQCWIRLIQLAREASGKIRPRFPGSRKTNVSP